MKKLLWMVLILGSGAQAWSQTSALSFSLQADGSLGQISGPPGLSTNNKVFIQKGGLWISGLDDLNRLYVAAHYLPGNNASDFWSGPMDTLFIKATNPSDWNRIWTVNAEEISKHRRSWDQNGYQIPASILEWPGQGKTNTAAILAPFADTDFDGKYDPEKGDFPFFPGKTASYAISNDEYDEHQVSKAAPLKIEVHTMVYEPEGHDSVLFLRYTLFNRTQTRIKDLRLSFISDLTLGNPLDNVFYSDSSNHSIGAWNRDNLDDGLSGFGGQLPWVYVKSMNKPLKAAVLLSGTDALRYPVTDMEFRNLQDGLLADGKFIADPKNKQSRFHFHSADWPDTLTGQSKFFVVSVQVDDLLPGQGARWDIALGAGMTDTEGLPSFFSLIPSTLQGIYTPFATTEEPVFITQKPGDVKVFPLLLGASSDLHIHSDREIRIIQIIDALGKQVWKNELLIQDKKHAQVSSEIFQNISNNCLLVRIETETGVYTKRIFLIK